MGVMDRDWYRRSEDRRQDAAKPRAVRGARRRKFWKYAYPIFAYSAFAVFAWFKWGADWMAR